ncbi:MULTISPECIES: hypothetical protein [unclassified Pseudomonas]|uniref:hypothetical protein n=1 Tax=unclassified Pseudomonas TaxID=196821 RepID=UPI0021CA2A3A|nr:MULTISPECIES: hypothetical protein [unclassified Pseudomonas]MCU1733356.1 hypothetical protein [Pseudomonas sp. 20P_3.2_Bac4]MCU1743919.1 hypothetical protein [Pseudomonas sp. 20P_3.2_Bac5]
MSGSGLIVPIDVTALVIGVPDAATVNTFAAVASDFSLMPWSGDAGPYLAEPLLPRPFDSVNGTEAMQPGIHLHWALPDSINRGGTDGSGKVEFLQAPNLWMVTRIAGADGSTQQNAWVIESDQLQTQRDASLPQNIASRAVPITPDPSSPGKPFMYQGRVYRQADWAGRKAATYASSNTTVGYGTPSYAAAYPHCPNVFSFWDPLDDAQAQGFTAETPLSYSVVGWYADSSDDPLGTLVYPKEATSVEDRQAFIAQRLNWSVSNTADVPDRTVCSGQLGGLSWDPERAWLIPPSASGIDVVIADNTAEAVAALLQARNPGVADLETLLNVFQQGMLAELGKVGGAAAADDAVHQSGFSALPGGTVWVARQITVPGANPAGNNGQLPDAAAAQLEQINRLQRSLDGQNGDLDALRQQLFVDWAKFMLLQFNLANPTNLSADQARAFIGNYDLAAIKTLSGAPTSPGSIDTTQTQINTALAALRTSLGTGWEVKPSSAPRYWQPADPVILLAGRPTTQASARHGGDGRFHPEGLLACRVGSQLVNSVKLRGATVTPQVSLAAAPSGASYPPELDALLAETLTLDPLHAPALARQLVSASGQQPANALTARALEGQISDAQHALRSASNADDANVILQGTAPSPVGLKTWQQPWLPTFLNWEVQFSPYQHVGLSDGGGDYSADAVTGSFTLDPDGLDFNANPGLQPSSALQSYSGTVTLAGRTEINLQSQLKTWLANYPDDPNAPVLESILGQLDLQAMAQSLNGFNQGLLMCSQSLQLPVMDALSTSLIVRNFTNKQVAPQVAEANVASPAPNNGFNPLRTGELRISKLRLVDAYGQAVDLPAPTPIIAERLKQRLANGGVADNGKIVLPPRLTQPARLQFRWLSALDGQAECGDQGHAPISGWVLFNHLDDALAIYDANGAPIGSLNTLGPRWQGAPGSDNWTLPFTQVMASINPYLANFVRALYDQPKGVSFLNALLATLDNASGASGPSAPTADPSLSVLIGRPLAVVRASLRLELQGQPAADGSWDAFAASVALKPGQPRPSAGIGNINFPVRLGDFGLYDDGMVGYFIEDGSESQWTTFYSPAALGGNGVVPVDIDKTAVTPVAASSPGNGLTLTLLIDPHGSVNATSGILPVKTISIPRAQWQPALDRIAVTFLTTPMVGAGVVMPVPTPEENGYSWQWVTRQSAGTGWTSDVPGAAVPTATLVSPQRIEEGWLRLVRTNG